MANETSTIEVLAEFAGETVAQAISTLARGEILAVPAQKPIRSGNRFADEDRD